MLHNLRARYTRDAIYTYTAHILFAWGDLNAAVTRVQLVAREVKRSRDYTFASLLSVFFVAFVAELQSMPDFRLWTFEAKLRRQDRIVACLCMVAAVNAHTRLF